VIERIGYWYCAFSACKTYSRQVHDRREIPILAFTQNEAAIRNQDEVYPFP
jgi:hypothetical protein